MNMHINIYYTHTIIFVLVKFWCCNSILMSNSSSSNNFITADTSTAILIRVDQSGNGDFKKIQDAINSVPSNTNQLYFISIKPGIYREKIVVPYDKPFVTLSGINASNTIITWNDTVTGDRTNGLSDSPTLKILASDFVGRYLTIQNTYGRKGKAVALQVSGDRAAFYACRILSYQDTLLDDGGSHYYNNCYIEGAIDFVFGHAASLYEKCHLHSISDGNGAITAHRRESPLENTGFVFLGGKLTGTGGTVLGRPWGPYARVIFARMYMSGAIRPEGWNDWGNPDNQKTVFYGEYNCYGPGAKRDKRVKWSLSLSSEEVAPFLNKSFIGGGDWLRPVPTKFKNRTEILILMPNENDEEILD